MTGQQGTAASERAARVAGPLKRHWMVIVALLGAIVFQLGFVASFAGAEARPALRDVTIGLVGTAPAPAGKVVPLARSAVSYQPLASAAAAREAVRDGDLPAALIVTGNHQTLVVAQAAGLTLTAAIEQVAATRAAASHASLAVADARPFPPGDPRGAASFLLVLGWIIGGYLGMTLLSRVLGGRARGLRRTARLTAWTALYAVASAGLGVVLIDPLTGALAGHPWALLGVGALIVFAAGMSTAALLSLFGMAGILVAIVGFVVLGNPTSGGPVPVQMLSGGYRFLAGVLPNNAGLGAVHGVQYFDGNQIGRPLLVLALYAALALAVCFARTLRQPRSPRAGASAAPDPAPDPASGRQSAAQSAGR